jgi:hypothetical protein
MNPKLNLWKMDGIDWKEKINEEIDRKGRWYEARYGRKYFDDEDYKVDGLVDITVEDRESGGIETILTLMLVDKQVIQLNEVMMEYISKLWEYTDLDEFINDLRSIYGSQVKVGDYVSILHFM